VKDEFPKVTQQPIIHVDATPNDSYPLRILEAYRENCNCKWSVDTNDTEDIFCKFMNKQCDERAKILDKAIKILKRYLK
jgi:hypothetical protein